MKCKKIKHALVKTVQGFTLIETMIAVLLLSTAIAGPLTLAAKGFSSALIAKDQISAFYLAQDAMEYIRFKRDSSCLAAGSSTGCPAGTWLSSLVGTGLCSADGTVECYVDTIQDTVASCPSNTNCPVMNYDSTNHFYSYTTGSASPEHYVRSVQIVTPVGSGSGEAQVTITVSWVGQGGLKHQVTVRENIFDWE